MRFKCVGGECETRGTNDGARISGGFRGACPPALKGDAYPRPHYQIKTFITKMRGKFPFEIQSWYPHMKPADVHLWEKFIRANAGFFDSVDYDFPIGRGPDWLDVEGDELAKKQEILYKKKVDVVGYIGDIVWLIEVKPQAGSNALGQILSYEILFNDDFPDESHIRLGVVTNKAQNGYPRAYDMKGVRLFEVGTCSACAHYPSI